MKILSKQQADSLKTQERRKEIDEGIKLSKTIDKLRETKSTEEQLLRLFRDNSISQTKLEIDNLLKEKSSLQLEIEEKKKEREKLEAPIDLVSEWEKVEIEKKNLSNLKFELADREMVLINREALVHTFTQRESVIKEQENKARAYLQETQKSYEKTDDLRAQIEQKKKDFEAGCVHKEQLLTEKENNLITREFAVNKLNEDIKKERHVLLETGSELIRREAVVEATTNSHLEREEQIKETEAYTKRLNEEASKKYNEVEEIFAKTQKIHDDTVLELENRLTTVSEREKAVDYRESDLVNKKEQLEKDRQDIEREKLHIASQQETLRVAWLNIKKLQK